MPPIRQTRTAVSIDIKKEICEYILANPNVKQAAVASFFNEKYAGSDIKRTTINKTWKNREKWLSILTTSRTSHTFRQRAVQFPEVDKAM